MEVKKGSNTRSDLRGHSKSLIVSILFHCNLFQSHIISQTLSLIYENEKKNGRVTLKRAAFYHRAQTLALTMITLQISLKIEKASQN